MKLHDVCVLVLCQHHNICLQCLCPFCVCSEQKYWFFEHCNVVSGNQPQCEMLKTSYIQIYCVVNCLSVHTPVWYNTCLDYMRTQDTGFMTFVNLRNLLTFYQILKVAIICHFWFLIPLFWLVCVVDISMSSKLVLFAKHV